MECRYCKKSGGEHVLRFDVKCVVVDDFKKIKSDIIELFSRYKPTIRDVVDVIDAKPVATS